MNLLKSEGFRRSRSEFAEKQRLFADFETKSGWRIKIYSSSWSPLRTYGKVDEASGFRLSESYLVVQIAVYAGLLEHQVGCLKRSIGLDYVVDIWFEKKEKNSTAQLVIGEGDEILLFTHNMSQYVPSVQGRWLWPSYGLWTIFQRDCHTKYESPHPLIFFIYIL